MEQRRSAPHPFSRPQTSQVSHDPRFAPIPPPPYTSQSTAQRMNIPVHSDPFLRRGNEQDHLRTSPPSTNPPQVYNFPSNSQLTANLFPGSSDFANIAQPRRNSYGSATPFGDGGTDRYGSRIIPGTQVSWTVSLLPDQVAARLSLAVKRFRHRYSPTPFHMLSFSFHSSAAFPLGRISQYFLPSNG